MLCFLLRKCEDNQVFYKTNDSLPYCKNRCEEITMCGEVRVPQEHLDVSHKIYFMNLKCCHSYCRWHILVPLEYGVYLCITADVLIFLKDTIYETLVSMDMYLFMRHLCNGGYLAYRFTLNMLHNIVQFPP